MEEIRIVWKAEARKISDNFKLDESWITNTHLPSVVKFSFVCSNSEPCKKLEESMKTSPEMFDSLELQYVINGQKISRRTLKLQGSHFENSKMWTQLKNMNTEGPIRYLNSEDLKIVSTETTQNIVASVITDNDYADTGDELKLHEVVENLLRKNEKETTEFDDIQWMSVFWNPDWARPDKIASYLNKVYSKDETDDSIFRVNDAEDDQSLKFEFGGFNFGFDNDNGKNIKTDELKKHLEEKHSHVEWNGEVFTVKPIKLFRINLSEMSSNTTFATANIQVRNIEAIHSVKVLFDNSLPEQNATITPTLIMQRLTERMDRFEQELNANFSQLVANQQTELSELEFDIQANVSDMIDGVEEAQADMIKTIEQHGLELKAKFDEQLKYMIDPSKAANETIAKVNGLDVKVKGLETTIGWTTKSFCLMKNGNCPSGFSQGDVHAVGLRSWGGSGQGAKDTGEIGSSYLYGTKNSVTMYFAVCCK